MTSLKTAFTRHLFRDSHPKPANDLPPPTALPARHSPLAVARLHGDYCLGEWPTKLHPDLAQFLDYWLAKHGADGHLPSRTDIDPAEIPKLLPGIALIDVEASDDAYRFKYRLLGTRHSYVTQQNMVGLYLEDCTSPDELPVISATYTNVARQKLPHFQSRQFLSAAHGETIGYQRIVVPLAQDGETVNMLFGYWLFSGASDEWHWWRND